MNFPIEISSLTCLDGNITVISEIGVSGKVLIDGVNGYEVPGLAYAIRGRGRCVVGVCECFPPYRGDLCADVDAEVEATATKTALVTLMPDRPTEIAELEYALRTWWNLFNVRFHYPVVIFHDGLAAASRARILAAAPHRIWFAFVEGYAAVPPVFQTAPKEAYARRTRTSLGYRASCRFMAGKVFEQPVMRDMEYIWWLDSDAYFPARIPYDPLRDLRDRGLIYGWSHIMMDQPLAVKGFWDITQLYMKTKRIDPRESVFLREITMGSVTAASPEIDPEEKAVIWKYRTIMADTQLLYVPWFRDPDGPYMDYYHYLDSHGGWWQNRWGDTAVRTMALGMFLAPTQHQQYQDLPYAHQDYCRCPNVTCVRNGTAGYFICNAA